MLWIQICSYSLARLICKCYLCFDLFQLAKQRDICSRVPFIQNDIMFCIVGFMEPCNVPYIIKYRRLFIMLSHCKPSLTVMKAIGNIEATFILFTVIECSRFNHGCVQLSICAHVSKPERHDGGRVASEWVCHLLLYGPCMIVPHKWTKICWLATAN